MSEVTIRDWEAADADAVESLLDPHPDPYWLVQREGAHGVKARADRFAITLVATDASGVLGIATLYENRYHPGRYPATVEVRPDQRRQGVGRLLLTALIGRRPAALPLEVKLRDANADARGFAAAIGMRPFQHCPMPSVDTADPKIRRWADDRPVPQQARVIALGQIEAGVVVSAVVEQYLWVHERWAPTGDQESMVALWARSVASADPSLSSIAVMDEQVVATTLIWVDGGEAEAVAETTTRDQPLGTALVAACVARSLSQLSRVGIPRLEFDGHDDDPHLTPVIDSMPSVRRDPVSLLELLPEAAMLAASGWRRIGDSNP